MNLPVIVQPTTGEAFTSWFARLADANGATVKQTAHALIPDIAPHVLLRQLTGQPDLALARRLAKVTGLTPIEIRRMSTVHSLGSRDTYHVDSGTSRPKFTSEHIRYHGISFCPACLEEQGPSFLTAWRNSFMFMCPIHQILMHTKCPQCGQTPTGLPWHPAGNVSRTNGARPRPGRCQSLFGDGEICDFELARTPGSTDFPDWAEFLWMQVELALIGTGMHTFKKPPTKAKWELDNLVRVLRRRPPPEEDVYALVPLAETPALSAAYRDYRAAQPWSKDEPLRLPNFRGWEEPDRNLPSAEVMLVLCAVAIEFLNTNTPLAGSIYFLGSSDIKIEIANRLRAHISVPLTEIVKRKPPMWQLEPPAAPRTRTRF